MANKYVKSFNFGGDTLYPLPRVDNFQNGSVLRVVNGQWRTNIFGSLPLGGLYEEDGYYSDIFLLCVYGAIILDSDHNIINYTQTAIDYPCDFNGDLIISISDKPTWFNQILDSAFIQCPIKSVTFGDNVIQLGNSAFNLCPNLLSVVASEALELVGGRAFSKCLALQTVVLPGVITIDYLAFGACISLKSIVLGSNLTTIGPAAFVGCEKLTDVYYTGTEEQWAAITIDNTNNGNDPLLNATIHYNYTGNGSELN